MSGVSIDSHLVTQPVEVIRDEDTGDLLVKLTAGSSPRLEDRQLLLGLKGLHTAQHHPLRRNSEMSQAHRSHALHLRF